MAAPPFPFPPSPPPTTTTTTAFSCTTYDVENTAVTTELVSYTDCNTSATTTVSLPAGAQYSFCSSTYPSFISSWIVVTILGDCTPITTTTTTTTTTAAPPVPIVPSSTTITPLISVAMASANIQGTGVTYQQFIQSLGTYNYGAEFFYLSSNSYQQIAQPVYYNHFDANGNSISTFLPFAIDPYQSQPALYYATEPDQIMFTGLSSLQFGMYANSVVFFKFYAQVESVNNIFEGRNSPSGDNAFEELERSEGISFFEDYCNYIIDNDNQ